MSKVGDRVQYVANRRYIQVPSHEQPGKSYMFTMHHIYNGKKGSSVSWICQSCRKHGRFKHITVKGDILKSNPQVGHNPHCQPKDDLDLEIEFRKKEFYEKYRRRRVGGKDIFMEFLQAESSKIARDLGVEASYVAAKMPKWEECERSVYRNKDTEVSVAVDPNREEKSNMSTTMSGEVDRRQESEKSNKESPSDQREDKSVSKTRQKICGLCQLSFSSLEELCVHLQNVHDLPTNVQSHVFATEKKFQDWKDTVDKSVWDTSHFTQYGQGLVRNFVCRSQESCTEKASPTWDCSAFIQVFQKSYKPRTISVRACLYHYCKDLVRDEAEGTEVPVPNEAEEDLEKGLEIEEIMNKISKISDREVLARISEKALVQIQELVKIECQKKEPGASSVGSCGARKISKPEPGSSADCYRSFPPVVKKRVAATPLARK